MIEGKMKSLLWLKGYTLFSQELKCGLGTF